MQFTGQFFCVESGWFRELLKNMQTAEVWKFERVFGRIRSGLSFEVHFFDYSSCRFIMLIYRKLAFPETNFYYGMLPALHIFRIQVQAFSFRIPSCPSFATSNNSFSAITVFVTTILLVTSTRPRSQRFTLIFEYLPLLYLATPLIFPSTRNFSSHGTI